MAIGLDESNALNLGEGLVMLGKAPKPSLPFLTFLSLESGAVQGNAGVTLVEDAPRPTALRRQDMPPLSPEYMWWNLEALV